MPTPSKQSTPPNASARPSHSEHLYTLLSDDSNKLVNSTLELVASAMHVKHASLTFYHEGSDKLVIRSRGSHLKSNPVQTICGYAIQTGETLIIQNVKEDKRFRDSPLAKPLLQIRFYAGTPITFDGTDIKMTVCVYDTEPREFSEDDRKLLSEVVITTQKIIELYLSEMDSSFSRQQVRLDFDTLVHDLRSPFNALLNLADELIYLTENQKSSRIKEIANSLYKSSYAAFNAIQSVEYKYIRKDIEQPPTAFDHLLQDITDLYKPALQEKNIEIDIHQSAPISIAKNANVWKLALRNLISNSIKHSFTNSKICIAVTSTDQNITARIVDFGTGMPDELLAEIQRGNPSGLSLPGTENEMGSGHGLQLCFQCIEHCSGKLAFDSKIQVGTSATLTLPN